MLFNRLLSALPALLLLFMGLGVAHAEGERVVLLEDPEVTDNRLHYPLLISNGRGYRIRCPSQQGEEAVIHGMGFATVPSQILTATDPGVVAADPLSNPLLCPQAADYPIKVFAHSGASGPTYYLQFPAGFGSSEFTDRIYVPGCTGIVNALALDLTHAINADPTPFFAGKIHQISCLSGTPIAVVPETFAAWCVKGDRTDAETATVTAMLDATPGGTSALGNAAACQSANEFLGAVTSLNLNGKAVQSTAPLSVLKHLTNLALAGNEIADISELSKLRSLTFLDLSGNRITSIAALAPLSALTNLNLSDNGISDIRALSALATLTRLKLDGNSVHDLEPLQFMQALSNLSLARNGLTGDRLEPLTALGALTHLDLSSNNIASFENLGEFPSTLEIDLSGNPIAVTGGQSFLDACILHRDAPTPLGQTIRAMIQITGGGTCAEAAAALSASSTLDLSAKAVSALQPVATLTHLTHLNLQGNAITDVSTLSGLGRLVELNLADNNITDIRPIGPLLKLTTFDAKDNPVSVADYLSACLMRNHEGLLSESQAKEVSTLLEISGAATCQQSNDTLRQLQFASVRNRGLTSLAYFRVMENLRSLDVLNNALTDLSDLAPIASLVSLAADNNQIASMTALTALRRLEVLSINGNPLTTLNGIANLQKLKRLYFSNTTVRSVQPLGSLPELQDAGMRNLDLIYQAVKEYCLVHKFDSIALGADRALMIALDSRLEADNVDRSDCDAVDAWASNLKVVTLNKKSLTSVRPLRFFAKLEELYLFDNSITDVAPIASLRELRKLNLARNRLAHLPGLASSGLRELYVSENNLTNLQSVPALGSLTKLVASDNRIPTAASLAGMGSLSYIDLRNNVIANIGAIAPLLARQPYLMGNPVCVLRISLPGFREACTRRPFVVIGPITDVNIAVGPNVSVVEGCGGRLRVCPDIRVRPLIVNP